MEHDNPIGDLIAAGFLLAVGYGIYKVLKAFEGHNVDDILHTSASSQITASSKSLPANQPTTQKTQWETFSDNKNSEHEDKVKCLGCGRYFNRDEMLWENGYGGLTCGGCWCE